MHALTKTIIVAAALLTACGDSDAGADCLALPCPLALALRLSVSSATSGTSIAGASVAITGAETSNFSCNGSCEVQGGPGTYNITVSAAGFTSVQRSVHVTGTNPKCGCASADTQDLTIALEPSS